MRGEAKDARGPAGAARRDRTSVSRRSLLRAAAALGLTPAALLQAGCGRRVGRRQPSDGQLRLLVGAGRQANGTLSPRLLPSATSLAAAYARAFPKDPVPTVHLAQPSLAGAVQGMLAGRNEGAPDVLVADPSIRNLLYAPALMLDVGAGLRAADLSAGIYPSLLRFCAPGGRQVLVPLFRDPLVVFYNSDALARAGANPPADGWTLTDLVRICQEVQLRLVGRAVPLAAVTRPFNLELLCAFVTGFGGRMLATNPNPRGAGFVPRFASPTALNGIRALNALRAYEPALPPPSAVALFAQGGAALLIGHHRDIPTLQARIGASFAWGAAPLPVFPHGRVQPVQADGVAAVPRNPAKRGIALRLALFTATPEAQYAVAATGSGVPALRALAGSTLWRRSAPHLNNDVFVAHPEADLVVPPPLHALPELASAMADLGRGVPAEIAFGQAQTAAELTLATWPRT